MSGSSIRRMVGAALYVAAGLVFALEALANRVIDLEGKGASLLPKLSGMAQALRTESLWDIVYTVLIVLSTVVLVTLVQGRGAVLVTAGGAITLVGNLAHSAVVVVQVLAANMATQDPASMVRLWDSFNNDMTLLPILAMIIIYPLGGMVMAAGFVRAGIIGWWVVGAWVAMTILDLVLRFPGSHSVLAVVAAIVVTYTAARVAFPRSAATSARALPAAA